MPTDSRSRMISFRLSETDYEGCRRLCLDQGLSSVSEMARTAIQLLLTSPEAASQRALETRVREIEGRIHLLTTEFRRLHPPPE